MRSPTRWIGLATLFALVAPVATAQDLQAKKDAKMQEAWFKAAPWTADYDEARKLAAESGKVIFAYFTRSYAY